MVNARPHNSKRSVLKSVFSNFIKDCDRLGSEHEHNVQSFHLITV